MSQSGRTWTGARRSIAHRASAISAMLGLMSGGLSAASSSATAQALPSRPPQRIISLAPAFTEATCMLGACSRLVATDSFSDWPAQVRSLPKLGSLEEVSVEAVARQRPDLILSTPGGRLNERLRALGLRVIEMRSDSLSDIDALLNRIDQSLGEALAGETRRPAGQLWAQAQQDITGLARELAKRPSSSVYIEVDPALYAAGPDSYLGQLLSRLGAQNIVPGGLGPFPRMAPEFMLTRRPAVIMHMHEGPGPEQRPGWQAMLAHHRPLMCRWTSAQISVLVRPGPRLGEAAGLMAACLRKAAPGNAGAS